MGYFGYGPMYGGWGGHGLGFGFGVVIMLLGLVLMVALVVGLLRWLSGSSHPQQHSQRSLDASRQARRDEAIHILEKRFAQGEIDEEEFLKRRSILKEQD